MRASKRSVIVILLLSCCALFLVGVHYTHLRIGERGVVSHPLEHHFLRHQHSTVRNDMDSKLESDSTIARDVGSSDRVATIDSRDEVNQVATSDDGFVHDDRATSADNSATSADTEIAGSDDALRVQNQFGDDSRHPFVSPNVHLFYYAWYGTPEEDGEWKHWDHVLLPHWDAKINAKYPPGKHVPPDDIGSVFFPRLGPYSSSSVDTIRAHFREISSGAGVGTIVVSWYPPGMADDNGSPELANLLLPKLLDVANEFGIQVAIHIEPYKGRTAESVMRDVRYLTETYGEHPSLCKGDLVSVPGQPSVRVPFIYIYDSYHISAREWANALWSSDGQGVRHRQSEAILIGLVVEKKDLRSLSDAGFHGMYTYFAADGFSYGSSLKNWREICEFCAEHDMMFVPSVGPGYDDTRVRPWNSANTKPRTGGDYYRRYMENAIDCLARTKRNVKSQVTSPVISITSYNEWHEGSQIESAVKREGYQDYGEVGEDGYIKLTREYVEKFEAAVAKG